MTYYSDLTEYSYLASDAVPGGINVGWLDSEHSFPTGSVKPQVMEALLKRCAKGEGGTRGWHACPFCSNSPMGLRVSYIGREYTLGSAEIRVPSGNGTIYVAPNLIIHYIREHGYRPPDEFIRALLTE